MTRLWVETWHTSPDDLTAAAPGALVLASGRYTPAREARPPMEPFVLLTPVPAVLEVHTTRAVPSAPAPDGGPVDGLLIPPVHDVVTRHRYVSEWGPGAPPA